MKKPGFPVQQRIFILLPAGRPVIIAISGNYVTPIAWGVGIGTGAAIAIYGFGLKDLAPRSWTTS